VTKNADRRRRVEAEQVASAAYYTLITVKGRLATPGGVVEHGSTRERQEFWPDAYGGRDQALVAAKNARDTASSDEHGRTPLVYAVGTSGQTVLVE
jgi:hypothetical protein